MDRYIVVNEKGVVVNTIVWDGVSAWKPPEGHRVEINHDVNMGDIWLEDLGEYVRPLSKGKTPEDEVSISQRKASYLKAKESLKASILFLDPQNSIDMEK